MSVHWRGMAGLLTAAYPPFDAGYCGEHRRSTPLTERVFRLQGQHATGHNLTGNAPADASEVTLVSISMKRRTAGDR